jgi:hypothetical protein
VLWAGGAAARLVVVSRAGGVTFLRPGRVGGGIRAWAKDQGIAVSARGRIPATVVERYQAATKRP